MLDIKSSDKGLLIPRMSTIERNAIQNPEIGLMVFDKDLQELFIYNSDGWKQGTLSKLPLILNTTSLRGLVITNDNTNSFPNVSTAAEFISRDILGIALKAESSGNPPTMLLTNYVGNGIESKSEGNGIGGSFNSTSGIGLRGLAQDNYAIFGSNNSFSKATARLINNGQGKALELIGSATIMSNNSINTLRVENNKPFNIGGIDDEAAAVFVNNSPFGKGLISRTTNNGTAIEARSNGTGKGGYFYSENGYAIEGYSPNNLSILMNNNSNTLPTAKFINNGGGPAMELNSELNINTTRLTGGLNIKNNLIGNNGNFGSAVNIELTGGPGRALVVQSNGSNSHAIWGVATDSGIGVVGNSTNSLGGNFQSINGAGMQVSANNNNAIQGFNNSTNFPTAWFQNYFGNGSLALRLDGNLEINGKILNEAYQTPTFENSWTNFGGEWNTAKFYKGKDGRVYLEGVVTGGSSSVICTLPVGYRPASRIFFIVSHDGNGRGRIDIQANGVVSFDYGANRTQVGLDGISFRVD
jgi:hypothetical protein